MKVKGAVTPKMKCSICGQELNGKEIVCPMCGAKLQRPAPEPQRRSAVPDAQQRVSPQPSYASVNTQGNTQSGAGNAGTQAAPVSSGATVGTDLKKAVARSERKRRMGLAVFGAIFTLFGFSVDEISMSIGGLVLLAIYFAPMLKGGYPKRFEEQLAKKGVTANQVESDLQNGQSFPSLLLGKRYGATLGQKVDLIVLNDLVWCYALNTTTRYRAVIITVGKSYSFSVKMVRRDKSEITIPTRSADEQAQLLKALQERASWSIFGYNDDLSRIAKTDFSSFIKHADDKKREIF